jgi:transketolase
LGEQVGKAVEATLYYAPKSEADRLRTLNGASRFERVQLFADLARLNALYMIARAGSGHIGSSFSSMDIVAWLHLEAMQPEDLYFSSKGHDAPGLYAVLIALGRLPFEKLHNLRRLAGLPGHPDLGVPGMVVNSGSLGQGISKAKGIVMADRLAGRPRRLCVMIGDGELQEGQIWESLISAANCGLGELTVIVDHNKMQSDYSIERTSDLGDLPAKFSSFGWHVERIDGHDLTQVAGALERCRALAGKPKAIIADTIKGRGVSFMEHTAMESDAALYRFHSGAPDETSYRRAVDELVHRINRLLSRLGAPPLELSQEELPRRPVTGNVERLIPAYTEALSRLAGRNQRIVALDADLVLDTGLIPFRAEFPDRFIECGIAEQDMVSQAGGLALQGWLPIAHSFACFLAHRANEQIYTNATERTKILYVGSLAGLVPGGPGHSHQAVRDIAALAGVPGLVIAEPCCAAELGPLLEYLLEGTRDSAYLRLVSVPVAVPFALPAGYRVREGRGVVLSEGAGPELTVIGYGPVLLSEAVNAATMISAAGGRAPRIIALPWLNRVDHNWLAGIASAARTIVTLDNHYVDGGQGQMLAAAIAELDLARAPKLRRLGLTAIPVSGTNAEVLAHHKLDAASLAAELRALA